MVTAVEKVVVASSEAVATDTQSRSVERTPEGEVAEEENRGDAVVLVEITDFVMLAAGFRSVVLDKVFHGFHFFVLVRNG